MTGISSPHPQSRTQTGRLTTDHPLVVWFRRDVLPLVIERFAPQQVVLFDPPDRPANAGEHPPGLLIVSARFHDMPMRERMAVVRATLEAASPVRPLCLTPDEHAVSDRAAGPVLAAVELGVRLV